MNISQAAAACGLPVKTLRYYETLGLVVPTRHQGNAYREYTDENIRHLVFLQRGRAAGFSLEECQRLLRLSHEGGENDLASQQWLIECVNNIDARMLALEAMRQTLTDMMQTPTISAQPSSHSGMSFLLVDPRE